MAYKHPYLGVTVGGAVTWQTTAATAWIDPHGDLYLQSSVAQSDGRNVGSMTYVVHG